MNDLVVLFPLFAIFDSVSTLTIIVTVMIYQTTQYTFYATVAFCDCTLAKDRLGGLKSIDSIKYSLVCVLA